MILSTGGKMIQVPGIVVVCCFVEQNIIYDLKQHIYEQNDNMMDIILRKGRSTVKNPIWDVHCQNYCRQNWSTVKIFIGPWRKNWYETSTMGFCQSTVENIICIVFIEIWMIRLLIQVGVSCIVLQCLVRLRMMWVCVLFLFLFFLWFRAILKLTINVLSSVFVGLFV